MKARRNLYIFITAGIILASSQLIHAAANDFEKLRGGSANIKTIQADFVQKKSMKILSKPLVSVGRFYYAAPDSFRWEYLKPLRGIVIAHKNATRRFIYSGGKMVEDKAGGAQAMKIVLNEIGGWMNGRFDQNPSFAPTVKDGANVMITLTPAGNSMAGMIEKIEITLSKDKATVKSVKIIENADAFTRIDFLNVKTNKAIDSSVFEDVR